MKKFCSANIGKNNKKSFFFSFLGYFKKYHIKTYLKSQNIRIRSIFQVFLNFHGLSCINHFDLILFANDFPKHLIFNKALMIFFYLIFVIFLWPIFVKNFSLKNHGT